MYKNGDRMMAWIAKIEEIRSIPNADAICCYRVGGWWVVDKKEAYKVGDLCVYASIDSWIPHELAPFLSKGSEPREYNGIKGERLRTVKLRGQISQGLLLPLESTCANIDSLLFEGLDVSAPLNIQKWEVPVPIQMAGQMKGFFPSFIPKTDQERVQNLVDEIKEHSGRFFEITEKLEGSSMTCYLYNGEFGVCSRNVDLKREEENSFWKVAIEQNIEEKMRSLGDNFAIQGELIGPGVQGNIYKLSKLDYQIFDVYDIADGEYKYPEERYAIVNFLGLTHVPVINKAVVLNHKVDEILGFAEGKSVLNVQQEREGIVYKSLNKHVSKNFTFKAISNKYLMKQS